jgi:hypothetical protein
MNDGLNAHDVGLAAITAAAKKLAKQTSKSRPHKTSATAAGEDDDHDDNESESGGDDTHFESVGVSNGAHRKGRPPVHPPRSHSPDRQMAGPGDRNIVSPGMSSGGSGIESNEEAQGYAAIAPRSDKGGKEVHATPEVNFILALYGCLC